MGGFIEVYETSRNKNCSNGNTVGVALNPKPGGLRFLGEQWNRERSLLHGVSWVPYLPK